MKKNISTFCQMARLKTIPNAAITSSKGVNGAPIWKPLTPEPSFSVIYGISLRHCSSTDSKEKLPFYKKFGKRIGETFGGKTQDRKEHEKEIEEKIKGEEQILREIEAEDREAIIRRKQNKSKLHYSHRNILKGEPPQVGLHMDWDEKHMTRAYKAQLLGQFGRTKTGLDPSICWPTSEEMAEEQEKERVLYDNKSLFDILEEDRKKQKDETEKITKREKEIDDKLVRMDVDLKSWRSRVDGRKRNAQREIDKRKQILAELRQEFGYDVNTSDPQFAEKVAAKEKEFSKKIKEEKKREREERAKSYKESVEQEAKE